MKKPTDTKESKSIILLILRGSAIAIFMFLAFKYFIRGGGQQIYDTAKGKEFWTGIFFFGAAVVIAYGIRYKNVFVYLITAVCYGVYIYFGRKWDLRVNSPDLWNWYFRIGIGFLTVVPVLVDAIFQKRFRIPKIGHIIILALASAPVLFSLIYRDSFERGVVALFAMAWIYSFIRFEENDIKLLAFSTAGGGVLATTYVLLKCFIDEPYHFEEYYQGTFLASPIFAVYMCCGVVLCMAIYASVYFRIQKYKVPLTIAFLLHCGLFVAAALMANSRNTLLAVILTLVLFSYVWSCATKKMRYFLWMVGILAGFTVVFLGILVLFTATAGNEHFNWIDSVPQLSMIRKVGLKTLSTKSREGIIPDGSWLNCIDNFTSERLTIWICTVRQLKLFAGNSTNIHIRDDLYWPTHNTYLGFLNRYGIVLGGCLITAWFASAVMFIKDLKNTFTKKEVRVQTVIAAIWITYCSSVFLSETFYTVTYLMIVWLFMLALFGPSVAFNDGDDSKAKSALKSAQSA